MTVRGKRVFITGASSGIGKSTAQLFAQNGSKLVLLARNEDRLKETAEELRAAFGAEVECIAVDVRNVEKTQAMIRAVIERIPVDIAIINHGIGQYGRVANSAWTDLDQVLQTNITGSMAVAHALLPGILEQKGGSMVFISSILEKRPIPGHAAYCASKSAICAFANVLRLEVRNRGLHVGIVTPSRTDTAIFKNIIYSEQPRKPVIELTSPPSRVAKAILYSVRHRRRQVTVSVPGKLYTFFGSHFPRTSDFLINLVLKKGDR